MKKFSVGLPIRSDAGFTEKIIAERDKIAEVYFSFTGCASGRSGAGGRTPAKTEALFDSLSRISESGIALNLLFNAGCYGDEALSRALYKGTLPRSQGQGVRKYGNRQPPGYGVRRPLL